MNKLDAYTQIRKWLVNLTKYDFSQCNEYLPFNERMDGTVYKSEELGLLHHFMEMVNATKCKEIGHGMAAYWDLLAYLSHNYSLYSGMAYPVASPKKNLTPKEAADTLPLWKGQYGKNRVKEVECAIDYVDKKIEEAKASKPTKRATTSKTKK